MKISQRARDFYADAIAAQGPLYANAAHLVRGGFDNIWIRPGLVAIEAALHAPTDEDIDDDGG